MYRLATNVLSDIASTLGECYHCNYILWRYEFILHSKRSHILTFGVINYLFCLVYSIHVIFARYHAFCQAERNHYKKKFYSS